MKDDWKTHFFLLLLLWVWLWTNQLLAQLSVIHFGLRFDSFRVTTHTDALLVVPADEIPMGLKPILWFNIIFETKFPFMKMKAITTLVDHSLSTNVATVRQDRILTISLQSILVTVIARAVILHASYMIIDFY